jgi:hypothetical protein
MQGNILLCQYFMGILEIRTTMKRKLLLLVSVCVFGGLNAQIGINTESPAASLHVAGSMMVTNTPPLSGIDNYLAVNDVGLVGYTNQIPIRGAFLQGKDEQLFSTAAEKTALNNGTGVLVKWFQRDVVANNIVTIDEANSELVVLNDARYDISGSINYVGEATNTAGTGTAIKIMMQCKKVGTSTWTTITSGRFFHNYPALSATTYSFVLPGIAVDLSAGDRLRIMLARPNNLGSVHGSTGGNPRVAMPVGASFTRSLRIIIF